MKKKQIASFSQRIKGHKLILKMKLTFFMMVVCLMEVSASVYSQATKFSFNVQGRPVVDVLKEIESQSDFRFFYQREQIDVTQKVDLEVTEGTVEKVLEELFRGQDVTCQVLKDNLIVITPRGVDFNSSGMAQQQRTISGRVTDSSGASLPGVSVIVKTTTIGTITNTEGKYTLTNIPSNATLVFSFVGMRSKEILTSEKSLIDVVLEEETIGIKEVVAVGYGTQSKGKITSSVSTMETEPISNVPYSEMGAALAGRVSGVIVQTDGGNPGSIPSISIRGGSTPLFVIDGMIRDINVFSALNKEDIFSMSFLKDASATAVYGSRAANGIVLVTTKHGSKNKKPEIHYSNNFSYSTPTVPTELINSYDYAVLKNKILEYQGQGAFAAYSQEVLDTIKNGWNLEKYPNTDWWGTCIRDYSPQKEHNLSIDGGNQISKYFIGLGFLDQGSMYRNNATKHDRYSYRSNLTTSFDKIGLDVGFNLNGYLLLNKYPPYSDWDIFSNLVSRSPLDKAYNTDGTISSVWPNPLALIESPGYTKQNTYFNNLNLSFTWQVPFIKGLKLTAIGDYVLNIYNSDQLTGSAPQYDDLGNEIIVQTPTKTLYNSTSKEWNMEYHADYVRSWGLHNLSVLLAYTLNAGDYTYFQAYRGNYLSSAVDELFAGDPETATNSGSSSEWGKIGSVGRIKYDYKSKYLVELSGRYDGSDLFAKGDRFGFFPAISLGWVMSEEKFFSVIKENRILNSLKLRASGGIIGNISGISSFSYVPKYNLNSSVYAIGGTLVNGYSNGGLVSNDISWYTTKSVDLGFDFTTLNNHLSGKLDYFYSRTSGYVTSPAATYSATLGTSLPVVKSDAAYRRAGFDGEINYSNKIGNVNCQIGFNVTHYNSLWENANESDVSKSDPYTRTQGTKESYYGSMYQSNGLYQSIDDIYNNPRRLGATNLTIGDIWYEDTNGDGKIDGQDFRRLGKSSSPRFIYGIPINLEYKGLSLDMLVQGTGKRNLYMGWGVMSDNGRVTYDYEKDYWTENNTDSRFPRLTGSSLNSSNNSTSSTYWLMNAQYIRLKSLTLSYDLKRTILKNEIWLNKFSIFFSGTNLLTISDVMDYFDPEAASTSSSSTFRYPVYKNYSFGINVGF